jgi:hypothetical protein
MGTEVDLRGPRLGRFEPWPRDSGMVDSSARPDILSRRSSLSRTCIGVLHTDEIVVKRASQSCPASPPGKPKLTRATPKTAQLSLASKNPASEAQDSHSPVRETHRMTEDTPHTETSEKSLNCSFRWAPGPRVSLGGALSTARWSPAGPKATVPPPKRLRALHDVDGPGTGSLPCKKRRIRYHLCTSRLSQPYSLPATHIHNADKTPTLSQFLRIAAIASKKAGHQPALVRKAAILNRVRINVRQAAVSRGHTQMASLAERQNVLNHGLQAVTAPASSTGARFPGHVTLLWSETWPGWRPHTTGSSPPPADQRPLYTRPGPRPPADEQQQASSDPLPTLQTTTTASMAETQARAQEPPVPRSGSRITAPAAAEEEDDVSFPTADFDSRYADLSDDDMDAIEASVQ